VADALTGPALLRAAAAQAPQRTAIVDGALRMTYGELADAVDVAARGLAASGVVHGDRVCVWGPNTAHWIVAALAVQSAGAALVPVNTRYTGDEALTIARQSRARALLAADRFLDRDYVASLRAAGAGGDPTGALPGLPDLGLVVHLPVDGGAETAGVIAWDELLVRGGDAAHPPASPTAEDVADVLFTSGTTGTPKGAMSLHRQTIGVASAWADCAQVVPEDRYLLVNPLFHSFGYKAGLIVCLLRGATMILQRTFDVDAVLTAIAQERVSILPGAPTVFSSLLAHPDLADSDTSSLRLAVTGAAMVPVALVERMIAELSFETVITAYGLSEAVVVTMCRAGDDPVTVSQTSGRPTAEFEVRVADPDGVALAPGEDGEILVRGPNTMVGYFEDPAATAEAIEPDGWLHTGDVGHLDERGYLTVTDRIKDMFTVGGFNVYPAEIEQVISRIDGVLESAVIGVPDERLGEVGAAYVVAAPGRRVSADEVLAHCRTRLANFKRPRTVTIVDQLPRNAAGKVLKRELRTEATDQ
jgi:acyl-CoA synthetase (AMP-forming)/AMP-acid ligase II